MIGAMAMPVDFKYRAVFLRGQPRHHRYDDFRIRHPAMDCGRRAKIFSPFDALKGFDSAIASKEILYVFRRELDEGEKEELNKKLNALYRMTYNRRAARENRVQISVTYYVPCSDKENFAFGYRGQYITVTGICQGVGFQSIYVGKSRIPIDDITEIEGNVFSACCRDSGEEYSWGEAPS